MNCSNYKFSSGIFYILPSFLFSALLFLCILLLIPPGLQAQGMGGLVEYQDSIIHDEEQGKLFSPSFVLAERKMNEIYVIDAKSRIIVYTSDLFPLITLDKKNNITSPIGLDVDRNGNLYVIQSSTVGYPRHRISVFNACFKWERDIFLEGFEDADTFVPHRLRIDKTGNLYVAAPFYPGILVLDNNGRLLEILTHEEDGKKVIMRNLNFDAKGMLYLVSEKRSHIYVFDENRKFLFKFGEKGGSFGKLSRPWAVDIDDINGRIYVMDRMRHTILIYDTEGNFQFEFGGKGWGEGWFRLPTDLSVDSSGRVLISELFNHRVQVFKPR